MPKRPVGRYIVGLAVIAIAAVVSTILTSTALTRQEKDAGVLEVVTQLRGHAGPLQLEHAEVGLAASWRGVPTTTGAVAVLSN